MKKPTPIFQDEIAAQVARMGTLLGMLESIAPRPPWDDAALARAGFSTEPRPPVDPFLGRRIVNEFNEREAKRQARRMTREPR